MIRVSPLTETRASGTRAAAPAILHRALLLIILVVGCLFGPVGLVAAQLVGAGESMPSTTETTPQAATPSSDEGDVAEPDFIVVNLPTTRLLPVGKGNFRISHRFAGNLRNGSFGQQAENLFGLDLGAIIGFEYRYGVTAKLQAVAFRTNYDKTIQFHAHYDVLRQGGSRSLSVGAIASIEGTNNFRDHYSPAVGLVVSRTVADRWAFYAAPTWLRTTSGAVAHAHDAGATDDEHQHHNTAMLGLGGRARVWPTVYLVGEITPRVAEAAPDQMEYGFGIEKRAGKHAFSLTFTNSFGLTLAQVARGGTANSLYLGFNIGRKFF